MKSELRFEKKRILGVPLGKSSVLPAMRNALHTDIRVNVEETDGLFIGYGFAWNSMPYTMQDQYGTEMEELEFDSVILENDFLKAIFIPSLGGRLWSLYDKVAQRDLITDNPVFKPGNFAVRNAWFAGGVEWNIGRRGHDPQTCSPRFAAHMLDCDGTPVLRIYDFCRERGIPFQMDFFLPEKSRFLYARMRIVNPHQYVVPVYWWSNIAVREEEGMRIVVPAETTFSNTYVSENEHFMKKMPLPFAGEDFDGTYPTNHWTSKDHFFNILPEERKFEAAIYKDGYGLIHTSTDRLQGRKMFVWGRSPGGRHWQRNLTSPDAPDYLEIQAGLAKTQQECLPMPPENAWEWLEAYGPIQTAPEKVFGEWKQAVDEVSGCLAGLLPRKDLDNLLETTRTSIALKKAEVISYGAAWGSLEEYRTGRTSHLYFGPIGKEQSEWLFLLDHGFLPEKSPSDENLSYLIQPEWFAILKSAAKGPDSENWYTWFQLGLNEYCRNSMEDALTCIQKSLSLKNTVWGTYALANIYRVSGDIPLAAKTMAKALSSRPCDGTLAKETLKTFLEAGDYKGVLSCYHLCDKSIKELPMLRFLFAFALAHSGDLEGAEEIISGHENLVIPDIREGENSISELYIYIVQEKARREGRHIEVEDIEIPFDFDLRMNSRNNRRK